METPEFVVSWSEVTVAWGPELLTREHQMSWADLAVWKTVP